MSFSLRCQRCGTSGANAWGLNTPAGWARGQEDRRLPCAGIRPYFVLRCDTSSAPLSRTSFFSHCALRIIPTLSATLSHFNVRARAGSTGAH